MPEKTRIQIDLDGIGHQLVDRLLAVPIYQRSYSWGDDQIMDFCSDLKSAFSSDLREYFLGTVVLSKEGTEGRDTIIDGQQRMATTSILIACIRDYFRSHGEESRADGAHSDYIGSYDMEEDCYVPRLFLNSEDDEFYRTYVVDANHAAVASKPSQRLIKRAVELLDKFVTDVASSAGSAWTDTLVKWLKFIRDQVRIISVEVPNESDAFMIFETLNDRGADLTLADLLKNYLFGKAGNKLEAVRENWLLSIAAFDLSTEVFITFLRHFWSSKYGLVRERDLYKSIKVEVANKTQAVRFADEIQQASRLYAAILNSEHEFWADHGTTTKDNIDTLNRLALEQNRPMLLAVLQHFTIPQQKKVLRSSISWSVRGLIAGRLGSGTTEKAYCNAAVKVRSGTIKTAAHLLTELSPIIASDSDFKDSFDKARVTKASLARYYLLALERTAVGTADPELVPNANEEEVNLEHVLPKKAKPIDWPQFTEDELRDSVDRLGNLALLKKSQNTTIGNKPFSIKQPILASSQLELTKNIGTELDWTTTAIADRQKRLSILALTTWKRNV